MGDEELPLGRPARLRRRPIRGGEAAAPPAGAGSSRSRPTDDEQQQAERVRAAMGTLPRRWFNEQPSIEQAAGRVPLEPSPEQAERLMAVVPVGGSWTNEVRGTRTRVGSIELSLGALLEASSSLIAVLNGELRYGYP